MTVTAEFPLITHLLRPAGLGLSHDELQEYAELGYEAAVEKLLNPKSYPNFDYYDNVLFQLDVYDKKYGPVLEHAITVKDSIFFILSK